MKLKHLPYYYIMIHAKIVCLGFLLIFVTGSHSHAKAVVDFVAVKTTSKINATVNFYYRIPDTYNPVSKNQYRVLVYFGGKNTSGEKEAAGVLDFGKWADEHEIFIVAPGYKDDDYWFPEKWSGRALIEALSQIKKNYKINDEKLLYYGYSGGSQCSNLFAFWRPNVVRAWVSHACGVFHKPTSKMIGVSGLVTCGDADTSRYVISRRFVADSRKQKINIIWKSFPNAGHEVPERSTKIAQAFLAYYHHLYANDLNNQPHKSVEEKYLFIGDDQDGIYYPINSPQIQFIGEEDKVYLCSKELAEAWGTAVRSVQ